MYGRQYFIAEKAVLTV